MIGLIQRVSLARVEVENQTVAHINQGILALIGIERTDSDKTADRLLERILGYRIFSDPTGKMNLDLKTVGGELLLVPQFTLVADTKKGMRPSFSSAAPPDRGKVLYDHLLATARKAHPRVESGSFAADMKVTLTNDGPVTFWLQV